MQTSLFDHVAGFRIERDQNAAVVNHVKHVLIEQRRGNLRYWLLVTPANGFRGLIAFLIVGWEYFERSFMQGERIVTSPWMPIIYPFKFVIPLTAALLIIQGVSEFLKSVWAARHGEWL